MVSIAYNDLTVTTWGRDDAGQQVWRARRGEQVVHFTAARTTPEDVLHDLAMAAFEGEEAAAAGSG